MKKKAISSLLAVALGVSMLAGCSKASDKDASKKDASDVAETTEKEDTSSSSDFKVSMVTDTGGVNDQSFNQSAWEGLQEFEKKTGCKVNYLESTQESDYASNLDKQVDEGNKLVWGIGYAMADALIESAEMNPEINYAIIDNAYEETPDNVTGVVFTAQDPSFMVGYAAGLTTETDRVGFVGGMKSAVIDQFEFGYRAGVGYAAKELGKDIKVDVQYAESYSDSAKGKAIASKMYSDGCDIVFHAAGNTGVGVIEAATEADKFVIGVDRDQSDLAPKNVLTSALKLVNVAVELLSEQAMSGENIGGKTMTYGLKDDAVGIPTENPNMSKEVYDKTMEIKEKIANGEIVPPYDEDTFNAFKY